jgi:hypothetical protein
MPAAETKASLAPSTGWVVSGSLLWVADAATGAVQARDERGNVTVSGTLPLTPRPFDLGAVGRARDAALANARSDFDRARARAVYDPALLPSTMPFFDLLASGHDGELWIRLFEVEPGPTREYLVVSRSGAPVARVELPSSVTVHQVGANFVLGVRPDADGVEEIVKFRLERP